MTIVSPCYTAKTIWYEERELTAADVRFSHTIRRFLDDSGYAYPPHAKQACLNDLKTVLDLCSAGF